MNRKPLLFTLLLLMLAGLCFGQTNGGEVMMQGFHWESGKTTSAWYDIVQNRAEDIGNSQIDAIWLPPPSDAASDEGYLPRELYVLDNSYGTEAQHRAAINALHNNNVKVLADIVINHRVGTTGWGDFTNPTWDCSAVVQGDSWPEACGSYDTGSSYDPARDLDHTNGTVNNDIKAWMNWLRQDVGYDGWRYDYVHGYGANFIKEYNDATAPYFSVGELWDGDRQRVVDWIDATQASSTAFDFPLKYALHEAVGGNYASLSDQGNAPGLIGWWPEQAVTFIDNHDTGSTQNYDPFPADKVMQGYAYILTHPGTPMVFWEHYYDWGLYEEIKALIKTRKDNGLNSTSKIEIQQAGGSVYAAIIDGKVAMKIGAGSWSPGADWTLRSSGTDYAVWDKGGSEEPQEPASAFSVYFKKPADWASGIKIHHWGAEPAGSLEDSSWPGVDMADDGNGWYRYTFNNISATNLLFHDNNGRQSSDLTRGQDGWYENGVWYDQDPRETSTTSGGLTIHFKTSWDTPTMYYWNVEPAGVAEDASWPGVAMSNDGDDWWSYTIADAECANLIFSNNGASQTADLYRCGDGWYVNGSWYDDKKSAEQANMRTSFHKPEAEPKGKGIPEDIRLMQNFPNPAGNLSTIQFNNPSAGHVSIILYNPKGMEVAVLVDEILEAGQHTLELNTSLLPNGTYYYKLITAEGTMGKKMIISR
jgi:alpha-amylase